MVRTVSPQSGSIDHMLFNDVLASGQISRKDYLSLASSLLSDTRVSAEERRQINRIFDYVQTGRLKLVD